LSTARKCGSPGEGGSFVVASVRKEIARPAGRESRHRRLRRHRLDDQNDHCQEEHRLQADVEARLKFLLG
jgi:hypothetical protein